MADAVQYNFQMTIEDDDSFEVYRFGFDPNGFHRGSSVDNLANSDSLTTSSRFSLQVLRTMVESEKTILFTKRSDLATVKLVEAYLQKQKLGRVFLVATQTVNDSRTTTWLASVDMKDVWVTALKTRQVAGVLPDGERIRYDVVCLRADKAFERDYDMKGNPDLTFEEMRTLNNQPLRIP